MRQLPRSQEEQKKGTSNIKQQQQMRTPTMRRSPMENKRSVWVHPTKWQVLVFVLIGIVYVIWLVGQSTEMTLGTAYDQKSAWEGISTVGESRAKKAATAIPHKLIFLDTRYTSPNELPKHFYDNIMRTATHYREAWDEPNAPIWYLGNDECRHAINKTEPRLLPFFDKERRGQNLANICRIAALYLSGGYYFDTDMKSVKAVQLEPDTLFSSVHEWHERGEKGLFNSFIATVAKHPVLEKALELMLGYYHGKVKIESHMGTSTLMQAYVAVPEEKRGKVFMLDEIDLVNDPYHRDFPRQDGVGCCCNYAVEDRRTKRIHFYSRMVGAGKNCDSRQNDTTHSSTTTSSAVSGLSKIICETQELPDLSEHEKRMKEARALGATLSKRCEGGFCKMRCGGNNNFIVPQPPAGTLLSIHQATAIWCALDLESKQLGRPANLLVWGLGNDSTFWANATAGRVAFIENNAQWFSKIQKIHKGLEQYLVQYHTSIKRDISRLGTAEFELQSSDMLGPLGLNDVTWDVILVDAPNGCSERDVGRFAPIYTSKQLVTKQGHGHVFVDDYQRTPERKTCDFVLDRASPYCPSSRGCGKRVAVWDRIHPASGQYIEELAAFSFGSSTTDDMTTAMLNVEGAKQ